jgi:predicted nucleic acid-binding protein
MTAAFADTFYFLALLNRRDPYHERAVTASRAPGLRLVTTDLVLIELSDALCKPPQRQEALQIWRVVESDPNIELIQLNAELLQLGRELFSERHDKEWPLTDCISFVVMHEHGLVEALTADRHFEQAGFRTLLS